MDVTQKPVEMCMFNVLKYLNGRYFNNGSFINSEVKKKIAFDYTHCISPSG